MAADEPMPVRPECRIGQGVAEHAEHVTYLTGVLDSIVTEANATRGRLTVGIATAILILDRAERFIVSPDEARWLFEMADTGGVCGEALLTRQCPHDHEWVTVTTTAGETFSLPVAGPSHGAS